MATILSPTRGGKQSYLNQNRAIAFAKEREAKLIFLYVCDVRFDHQISEDTVADVEAELEDMGEFLLSMAQERAAEEGIEAETVVRTGNFREVLNTVIMENQVDTLILGSSLEESGNTTPVFLRELSADLAKKYSLEVILLRAGELLETIAPV